MDGAKGCRPCDFGRNILILRAEASIFPAGVNRTRKAQNSDYKAVMSAPSPWWDPHVYADRRPFLQARSRIVAAFRYWFQAQGFVEVETPILQISPGNETHLHALATEIEAPDQTRTRRYLHTSPEFTCKKLLAAGETKIVTFARAFRNRERGPLHHPEFTMLEWYRANESYETLMDDCAALIAVAAKAAGSTALTYRDRSADPFAKPERLTVADAFQKFAGIDLMATMPNGNPDSSLLAAAAQAAGIQIAGDDTWSDIFSRVVIERVEKNLGHGRATILMEYPTPEAALARPAKDPRVAERFELYACGVELVNAFGELTDAKEQRRRFEESMAEKERRYGKRYPIDADFLAALERMPPASGIALGLDRLIMLATGAPRIENVLWAPVA
jgi:lysyl-tRNA synthetase class 2